MFGLNSLNMWAAILAAIASQAAAKGFSMLTDKGEQTPSQPLGVPEMSKQPDPFDIIKQIHTERQDIETEDL